MAAFFHTGNSSRYPDPSPLSFWIVLFCIFIIICALLTLVLLCCSMHSSIESSSRVFTGMSRSKFRTIPGFGKSDKDASTTGPPGTTVEDNADIESNLTRCASSNSSSKSTVTTMERSPTMPASPPKAFFRLSLFDRNQTLLHSVQVSSVPSPTIGYIPRVTPLSTQILGCHPEADKRTSLFSAEDQTQLIASLINGSVPSLEPIEKAIAKTDKTPPQVLLFARLSLHSDVNLPRSTLTQTREGLSHIDMVDQPQLDGIFNKSNCPIADILRRTAIHNFSSRYRPESSTPKPKGTPPRNRQINSH